MVQVGSKVRVLDKANWYRGRVGEVIARAVIGAAVVFTVAVPTGTGNGTTTFAARPYHLETV